MKYKTDWLQTCAYDVYCKICCVFFDRFAKPRYRIAPVYPALLRPWVNSGFQCDILFTTLYSSIDAAVGGFNWTKPAVVDFQRINLLLARYLVGVLVTSIVLQPCAS